MPWELLSPSRGVISAAPFTQASFLAHSRESTHAMRQGGREA